MIDHILAVIFGFMVIAFAIVFSVYIILLLLGYDVLLIKAVKAARAHALSKGLIVREAAIPYWDSYWAKKARGSSSKCTEYSLNHAFPKTTHWAFLQREEKSGNEFPNGWCLVVEKGQIPARLKVTLHKIAKEWTEEYLEFESTPVKISAFCLSGGVGLVDKLFLYLKELSAVTD